MVEQSPVVLDAVFRALADPTRRAMLRNLAAGERSIGELAAPFRMSFAGASKHVRALERAGLVRRTVQGRTHICRLEAEPLARALDWLRFYERFWADRLDALERASEAREQSETGIFPHAQEQTMNEYGVITDTRTVRFERLLPGPIERVWSYLTESEKRATWLAGGPMELRPGGSVHLRFHHVDLSGEPAPERYRECEEESDMHGRVMRCEPPRLLSYTWSESSGEDSEVTFELTPHGDDVLLVLTHRRLGDRSAMLSVTSGWHAHLGILEDVLSARRPRLFWTTHAQAEAEYETRLPAG